MRGRSLERRPQAERQLGSIAGLAAEPDAELHAHARLARADIDPGDEAFQELMAAIYEDLGLAEF